MAPDKRLQVHYDGKLRVIADDIAATCRSTGWIRSRRPRKGT